mmetsp:Transcript_4160/g.9912  ORF Transcript_4160/g.9912 Transcript_4160/m.9912 type:complete len:300 (+) Transcript_4160:5642-6541(+)
MERPSPISNTTVPSSFCHTACHAFLIDAGDTKRSDCSRRAAAVVPSTETPALTRTPVAGSAVSVVAHMSSRKRGRVSVDAVDEPVRPWMVREVTLFWSVDASAMLEIMVTVMQLLEPAPVFFPLAVSRENVGLTAVPAAPVRCTDMRELGVVRVTWAESNVNSLKSFVSNVADLQTSEPSPGRLSTVMGPPVHFAKGYWRTHAILYQLASMPPLGGSGPRPDGRFAALNLMRRNFSSIWKPRTRMFDTVSFSTSRAASHSAPVKASKGSPAMSRPLMPLTNGLKTVVGVMAECCAPKEL